jgi:hypothetical protein
MGSTYVSIGFCSIVLCVDMAAPRAITRDRSLMVGKQETENLVLKTSGPSLRRPTPVGCRTRG